jgi:large subunit ribosomal protein L23
MPGIIYRPIVTEKVSNLQEKGIYAFEVDLGANKIDIARAVEKQFRVTVTNVRTINMKGKTKTQMTRRGRFTGKTAHFKKAIVTLREGDTIDFLQNI